MRAFGGLLLGIGILIAGLSGLCTVMVVIPELLHPGGGAEDFAADIPGDLIIGGVPFAIGIGLFFLGRHMIRSTGADR